MSPSIPLREWIQFAKSTDGGRDAPATTSQQPPTSTPSSAYLLSSLRIALSLSRQICDAQEFFEVGLRSGIDSLPASFPESCADWGECVRVELRKGDAGSAFGSSGRGSEAEEGPRPPPFRDPSDANDEEGLLKEFLDMFAQNVDAEARVATHHNNNIGATNFEFASNTNPFLDVESAQIWSNEPHDNKNHPEAGNENSDKRQRIYSLGLVLYELFSGGDLPPPELLVVANPDGGFTPIVQQPVGEGESDGAGRAGGEFAALNVHEDSDDGYRNGDNYGSCSKRRSTTTRQSSVGSLSHDRSQQYAMSPRRSSSLSHDDGKGPSASLRSASSRSLGSFANKPPPALCHVNLERLLLKGVPTQLCDLVANAIDSINMEFAGNESYSDMSDVATDLQTMLDNPSAYLKDLDVADLSLSGLELRESVFVRKNEFADLQCAYRRSISRSSELAIVTGVSGAGKSTMASRFGEYVTANGGVFLSGKFDQMKQVKPFSAVASAFNGYCEVLATEQESIRAKIVASKLQMLLGPDLYYLEQVVPNLSLLLRENSSDIPPDRDCVNGQDRLHYLFCQFVEVISSCSGGPLVLFMDDMQWADSASISIICQLLKMSRSMQEGEHFFFLGSCRHDEMARDHLFWKMIEAVGALGFKTTMVNLLCMDKDTVNQVISNILHLLPRVVGSLSDMLYHKTKGNPLFLSRMLLSLNREGLLRISLNRRRWEWDEEKIQARKLPDDVAMFFVQSINSLHPERKMALGVLSCFGASIDCEVINALEKYLGLKLIEPLDDVIEEGLVVKLDGKYRFTHDRIQEAAYSQIDEQDCCLHHMNYGLSLMNLSLETGDVALLFTAVTQINLGGPSAVQEKEQYAMIANYNLFAGKKAMEMSDFSSAYSFFDHGISFLRKRHWQEHYNLSLELFNLAANCALAIKDSTSLTMICDQVSKNARCFKDELDTAFISMTGLTHSMISESVAYGIKILSQLGISIPDSLSREDALKLILKTQKNLSKISDEAILSYRMMSDYKRLMSMKFLAKLQHSIAQVKPALQPFVTVTMIQLTIQHGMSPYATIGFAYFGGMVMELSDVRGATRFTRLSKTLLEKVVSNEVIGEVIWVTTEGLSFVEPLQSVNEHRIQGQAAAMAAGDVHWACWNRLSYAVALLWNGANLSVAKDTFARCARFIEEHDHLTTLYYLKTVERTVLAIIGGEVVISVDELKQHVMKNKNPSQLAIIYFQTLYLSLLFNNYNDMKHCAEKFVEYQMPFWVLLSIRANHVFVGALASYRIFRETHNPFWEGKAKQFKERNATWNEQGSSHNFEHRMFLLEAEEAYSNGNFENVQILYDSAISSARLHKFVQEEALICELAANFFFNTGNKSMALKYFTGAQEKYLEWGALAKVKSLHTFIEDKFGHDFPSPDVTPIGGVMPSIAVDSEETRKRELWYHSQSKF